MTTFSPSLSQKQFKWKLPQKNSKKDLNSTFIHRGSLPAIYDDQQQPQSNGMNSLFVHRGSLPSIYDEQEQTQTQQRQGTFPSLNVVKPGKANDLIMSALHSNQIKSISISTTKEQYPQFERVQHQKRMSRRPSVDDEISLQRAVRYLTKMKSMEEKELSIDELYDWKNAVNVAAGHLSSTEQENLNSSTTFIRQPSLRNAISHSAIRTAKPLKIKRKPVPTRTRDSIILESTTSSSSKESKKIQEMSNYSFINSPKFRSDLCLGKLRSLDVDVSPFEEQKRQQRQQNEWTELQVTCDKFNSLIDSPPLTSNPESLSFESTQFELVTVKRVPKRSSTLPVAKDEIDQIQHIDNGFTKEVCLDSLKQLPDVSGDHDNNNSNAFSGDYRNHASSSSSSSTSSPMSEQHSSLACSSNSHGSSITNVESSPRTCETSLEGHEIESDNQFHSNRNKDLPIPKEDEEKEKSQIKPVNAGYRIKIPTSVKKSIHDQRWNPNSNRLGLEMEEDDSDEDDFTFPYSTSVVTKTTKKKPSFRNHSSKQSPYRSKNNDMMGMLDFLASGPPE